MPIDCNSLKDITVSGTTRIRIEPTQPCLRDLPATSHSAVQVMPDQAAVSQRNLVLINCAGVASPLEARIVRILTLETDGFDGRHSDAGTSSIEVYV
jgi:hypothetical protein